MKGRAQGLAHVGAQLYYIQYDHIALPQQVQAQFFKSLTLNCKAELCSGANKNNWHLK